MKILVLVMAICIQSISGMSLAAEPTKESAEKVPAQTAAALPPLAIADIIPRSIALSVRLADMERSTQRLLDQDSVERAFARSEARLVVISASFEKLKSSAQPNYGWYRKIRQEAENEKFNLQDAQKPLNSAIEKLGARDKEWRVEKNRWSALQAELSKEQATQQLLLAVSQAMTTIDHAQLLISGKFDGLLKLQAKGARTESSLNAMLAEIRPLILENREGTLLGKYPPMYSSAYFAQFRNELWDAAQDEFSVLSWPERQFFERNSLAFTLVGLLFVSILTITFRSREALRKSRDWEFVADRYISIGLFFCSVLVSIQLRLWDAPDTLLMLNLIVGGVTAARLLGKVYEQSWKRHSAYGVIFGYIVTMALITANLPGPLFRLYILSASVIAIYFCMHWAKESLQQNQPTQYALFFRLLAVMFVVVVIAQIHGSAGLSFYLFLASLSTLIVVYAVLLFMRLVRGGLHWLFYSSPVWQIKFMRNEADSNVRKSAFLANAAIVAFILVPGVLTAWNVYPGYGEALSGLLAPGFSIGTKRITIGVALAAAGILYGSFLGASIISRIVFDGSLAGRDMERGMQLSSTKLLQYFLILVGFLVALSLLGLDWSNLTILLSAFGIGIGFGLQGIVNNFVSGLILLFEQPLREGDTIEISGKERVHIKEIGLRATHVRTFDEADVIIPNADLVSTAVTNLTLGNRQVRLSVPVGVAYGSDVGLVSENLLACAKQQEAVLASPAPQLLFVGLGESSLDFELRVWIKDADESVLVRSQLYYDIVKKFSELNIEIPFPQRDLHLRSVSDSIVNGLHQSGKLPPAEPA